MPGRPSFRAFLLVALGVLAGCDESPVRGGDVIEDAEDGSFASVVAGVGSSGPRTDAEPEDAADFGPLPDFRLLSERGTEVTLDSLRGRPFVIGALFSTCTGPCPSIARGLQRLQQDLDGTDALIVVVSVDPEVDTPAVLARYGERMGADPERWIFLTGTEAEVHELVQKGCFLAVQRSGMEDGARLTHDTRLLAVDRAGRRRGWYTGTDQHQLERLRRRMLYLSKDDPSPEGEASSENVAEDAGSR